jgi:hypothetical protein
MTFPDAPLRHLRTASAQVQGRQAFSCSIFGPEWNAFVEYWAPIVHSFVEHALGPYAVEPHPVIQPMHDGDHSAGATASFNLSGGQIQLASSVEGLPGMTLEKLTHEMTHGSLAAFPEGDPFYEEGYVDYSVWVMAHAPVWGEYREAMIQAAAYNIAQRRDRGLRDTNDYDRKRWAGGVFAMIAHGPWIVANLKMKKLQHDLTW